MFERCRKDGTPSSNPCILVDDFITCTECGDLTSDEIHATYSSLRSHIDGCPQCTKNLKLSQAFTVCIPEGVYLLRMMSDEYKT